MSDSRYSKEELERYFSDPAARRGGPPRSRSRKRRGYLRRFFRNEDQAQAAFLLSLIGGGFVAFAFFVGGWALLLSNELPDFRQLDNPDFQLATVAYTADGEELARYAFQNRSWTSYDDISPHAVNALVATEDRRFHGHWGIDPRGMASAAADVIRKGELRGASTITQQLARNLYNQDIGFEVSVSRKIKEMITAVLLERRYTKREIIEMYLNTVPFSSNAYGIEAAARTYFNKTAGELSAPEGATLIGMLKANTYYNPYRNPENARRRRNVVLNQMANEGFISRAFYEEHNADSVRTDYNPSSEVTAALAPYFAEQVRLWMREWAAENGYNLYEDGLRVHTPLDSRMQEIAQQAVDENMEGLQAVVDYEWSDGGRFWDTLEPYLRQTGHEPWSRYWRNNPATLRSFVRGAARYRSLRRQDGISAEEAVAQLLGDDAFMDSLKAAKTRLQAGLVSVNPHNGYIKAWVGGRNLKTEWYDHVNKAARQPGSTFKPFVYTAAVDNGWPPWHQLPDSAFSYVDPITQVEWRPQNADDQSTGRMMSLAEGLAQSKNTITARVITELVNPGEVAKYAQRMGIRSELDPVPALALGTSDITLLELTTAFGTLASGGLHHDPVFVTRIEDRFGNMLYEHSPSPREALSRRTAHAVVNMMRRVITDGTGRRIRGPQFGLYDYDLAGKTGTTQNHADGWFGMMHPELVTAAWVGFNDRRVVFRSFYWGQGAHNALFLVGSYFRGLVDSPEIEISTDPFPDPGESGLTFDIPDEEEREAGVGARSVDW